MLQGRGQHGVWGCSKTAAQRAARFKQITAQVQCLGGRAVGANSQVPVCQHIISMEGCSDLSLPGNQTKIRTQYGMGGREKGGSGKKGWRQEKETSSQRFTEG